MVGSAFHSHRITLMETEYR